MNKLLLRSASRSAFTLVELLLVVAILGILAGVVVVNVGGQTDNARIQATRSSISSIGTALKTYEMNSGLPSSLDVLTKDQPDGRPPLIEAKALNDAWGTPFQYKKLSAYKFELRSAGADMKMGTEDDITN